MDDAQPNYNPPGGAGIPSEETWMTEAGEKTARPGGTLEDSSASGEDAGPADRPAHHFPLGAGKGSTGSAEVGDADRRHGSTSADEG